MTGASYGLFDLSSAPSPLFNLGFNQILVIPLHYSSQAELGPGPLSALVHFEFKVRKFYSVEAETILYRTTGF